MIRIGDKITLRNIQSGTQTATKSGNIKPGDKIFLSQNKTGKITAHKSGNIKPGDKIFLSQNKTGKITAHKSGNVNTGIGWLLFNVYHQYGVKAFIVKPGNGEVIGWASSPICPNRFLEESDYTFSSIEERDEFFFNNPSLLKDYTCVRWGAEYWGVYYQLSWHVPQKSTGDPLLPHYIGDGEYLLWGSAISHRESLNVPFVVNSIDYSEAILTNEDHTPYSVYNLLQMRLPYIISIDPPDFFPTLYINGPLDRANSLPYGGAELIHEKSTSEIVSVDPVWDLENPESVQCIRSSHEFVFALYVSQNTIPNFGSKSTFTIDRKYIKISKTSCLRERANPQKIVYNPDDSLTWGNISITQINSEDLYNGSGSESPVAFEIGDPIEPVYYSDDYVGFWNPIQGPSCIYGTYTRNENIDIQTYFHNILFLREIHGTIKYTKLRSTYYADLHAYREIYGKNYVIDATTDFTISISNLGSFSSNGYILTGPLVIGYQYVLLCFDTSSDYGGSNTDRHYVIFTKNKIVEKIFSNITNESSNFIYPIFSGPEKSDYHTVIFERSSIPTYEIIDGEEIDISNRLCINGNTWGYPAFGEYLGIEEVTNDIFNELGISMCTGHIWDISNNIERCIYYIEEQVPEKYRFLSTEERDEYFEEHSTELVEDCIILVGTPDGYQKYSGGSWIEYPPELMSGFIGVILPIIEYTKDGCIFDNTSYDY